MHYVPMQMRTHTQIVADVGEAALVAAGVSRFTAQSWRKRNSIPARHWPLFIGMGAASIEELATAAIAKDVAA